MTFPSGRILSPQGAADAARAIETPSEVELFEAQSSSSPSVRAFMNTPDWHAIRARIMGDGKAPLAAPHSLADLSRMARWAADSVYAETMISAETRAAYLHMASEIDAFARRYSVQVPAVAGDELAARRQDAA
jgi:hypothetical protein